MSLICPHCGKPFTLMAAAVDAKPQPVAQITGMQPDGTWKCPIHGTGHYVPAGIGKTSGKPYPAFWGCDDRNCKLKAPYSGPPPQTAPVPAPPVMDTPPDELVPF